MREIKFRGKRISDGDWFYGDLITEVDSNFNVTNSYIHIRLSEVSFSEDSMTSKLCLHEVDPKTVGQYTGLKDKNSKDIYEGDFLKWIQWNNTQCITPIEWDQDMCRYVFKFKSGEWKMLTNEYLVEVIGNIYSNPELLEVTP